MIMKKPSKWAELGSRAKEANYIDRILGELVDAESATRSAVVRARAEYLKGTASSAFRAKQMALDATNPLYQILTTAKIAVATSGRSILELPTYNDPDHAWSRAQRMVNDLKAMISRLEKIRSLLIRFRGDREEIGRALAALDGF